MRIWSAIVLLFLVGSGAAEDAPEFGSVEEAQAAVLKVRGETLQRLEAERLLIPERFFDAEASRHEATRAWSDKRFEEARAAYGKAWALYPECVGSAQKEHARLAALRQKRPPELRLGFKQRKAIRFALEWLARHQDPLGRWDCAGCMKHDPDDDRCDGAGNKAYDVGVTALAVLAFLEAGFSDRDNHYATAVLALALIHAG